MFCSDFFPPDLKGYNRKFLKIEKIWKSSISQSLEDTHKFCFLIVYIPFPAHTHFSFSLTKLRSYCILQHTFRVVSQRQVFYKSKARYPKHFPLISQVKFLCIVLCVCVWVCWFGFFFFYPSSGMGGVVLFYPTKR